MQTELIVFVNNKCVKHQLSDFRQVCTMWTLVQILTQITEFYGV